MGNQRFTEKGKEKAIRMQAIREKVVMPLLMLKQNLTGSKKVGQINQEIYDFLLKNEIQEKIQQKQKKLEERGKLELAKEQELAWNIVIQVLDEMEQLFAEDTISFEKYRELLKVGLSQNGLGNMSYFVNKIKQCI